ncbi:GntR family transcriptional regulator [Mangrovicoccus algicola]|uniref:GntR family transcriptional regulator n=1 Tax=Mangrovicoccus algicola TaxID=2771008 RepID=A0A8J6YRR7_9RHOB|nr:GntR family transcriptional regulator [Mangrovicoccus algicola]MBE3638208.1 GntR family transcriptional regulator [Mangrovicoccus algicola]
MPDTIASLSAIQTATATDQVFEALYHALITFGLPPGTKVSEAEIAKQLGVSRQPVRDAFFRLSQLGFLSIRPQRATLITKISEIGVHQAAYVRAALEAACIRDAAACIGAEDLAELRTLIARQKLAIETGPRSVFHELDDLLHRRICEMSGHGHAWSLIQEQKAHIDRVRFLSLSFGQQNAYDQHVDIVEALAAGDADAAETCLRDHLSRIRSILPVVRQENPQYFEDPET